MHDRRMIQTRSPESNFLSAPHQLSADKFLIRFVTLKGYIELENLHF